MNWDKMAQRRRMQKNSSHMPRFHGKKMTWGPIFFNALEDGS